MDETHIQGVGVMETAVITRTDRIVELMKAKTSELMEPVRRRISEEEQARKDAVASSKSQTYIVISTRVRVPMRGTRYSNRCA